MGKLSLGAGAKVTQLEASEAGFGPRAYGLRVQAPRALRGDMGRLEGRAQTRGQRAGPPAFSGVRAPGPAAEGTAGAAHPLVTVCAPFSLFPYQHEGEIRGRCQAREVHVCLNLGLHPVRDQRRVCQDLVDRTRSWLYAACSLSYLGAMVSSNSALQFVNYPTQVLGKSCKPIPVMLLGVTLLKKKYPVAKYLCVLLIVAGVALFMYKPKKGVGADEHLVGYGELLLLLSLTLDGLTGVSQDHMRAHYQTGSNHMMLNINLWSTLLLGAGILFTGEFWDFLSFTERYPSVLYNILLFGLTSALGQSFIFMTVVYFGPLTCSIITTTRKFFTILTSVILFANPISSMQWVGTVLVFMGLGLDAKFGKGSKKTSL